MANDINLNELRERMRREAGVPNQTPAQPSNSRGLIRRIGGMAFGIVFKGFLSYICGLLVFYLLLGVLLGFEDLAIVCNGILVFVSILVGAIKGWKKGYNKIIEVLMGVFIISVIVLALFSFCKGY